MIFTLTLNPALDYLVFVENFNEGSTNRSSKESIVPGGKGINVSLLLHELGEENIACGFLAGFTGHEIEERLHDLGIKTAFQYLKEGYSRINIKMNTGKETEINAKGPLIHSEDVRRLERQIGQLSEGDLLVLSGNIPDSLPKDLYKEILRRMKQENVSVIVDTTGESLLNCLEEAPFLIKPNRFELEEIMNMKLLNTSDIIIAGEKLKQMGAKNVLISLGGDGAVLVAEDGGIYQAFVPRGRKINSVGAGDSMIAGFIYYWNKSHNYRDSFAFAVASGSATAYSMHIGKKSEIVSLYKEVNIKKMK